MGLSRNQNAGAYRGSNFATKMGVPLEWFPISAGAKISMDSGVENMDWIARVLRRLVEFTQAGGK